MPTFAIANPRAAAGAVSRRRDACVEIARREGAHDLVWSEAPRDLERRVRGAVESGAREILVFGGDGSINEAVNGIFAASRGSTDPDPPRLSIAAIGTGADFARTLRACTADGRCDVGRVTLTTKGGAATTRYFVNVSSFGASARVALAVNRAPKWLGGRLSFWLGSLRGLASHRNPTVQLAWSAGTARREMELTINTVAVANARFFGGGMQIAPNARINDGLFEIVVIEDVGLRGFLRHSGRLYAGTHLDLPFVRTFKADRVEATVASTRSSARAPLVELDGEPAGALPVRYELLPGALRVRLLGRS